jgi:hypothetical protein
MTQVPQPGRLRDHEELPDPAWTTLTVRSCTGFAQAADE